MSGVIIGVIILVHLLTVGGHGKNGKDVEVKVDCHNEELHND
jgi:hypothetical protein